MASHTPPPVLLLMDSPRKQSTSDPNRWKSDSDQGEDRTVQDTKTTGLRRASLVEGAGMDPLASVRPSSDSLGRLLVEMTAQVQDERAKRSAVDKKNQSLLLEIEQLQKELLESKTSREQLRRRASGDWEAATRQDTEASPPQSEGTAEFWWSELQEAKRGRDKAIADAHQRAMQVMELNACVSMQHDELKALRASEGDVRFALSRAEDRAKELLSQHTILAQENQLLKDEVAHLNGEMGKRGTHFKALMDKWSEAQAQSEHLERENRAMLDKMKELRAKHEQLQAALEQTTDDRDALQHQINHLKGAVAAKAAESKAFQTYGTTARDRLQSQTALLQRHQIYRRRVNAVARDSVLLLSSVKSTLASVRAPLVTIQQDFKVFLKHLQTPVLALVAKSRRFAEAAQIEHAPLRLALATTEKTRRHLHEQLWKARRNALLVCQIRHINLPLAAVAGGSATDSILAMAEPLSSTVAVDSPAKQRTLRANYGTGELLLRESERDTVTVQCDALMSDRARGSGAWSDHESVAPLLQSVLDGVNACVATFHGLPPVKTGESETSVPELVLTQLFDLLRRHGAHFHRVKLTISLLGVYNEAIYDLLGMDPTQDAGAAAATAVAAKNVVVLEVQNAEEALLVLRGGCDNLSAAHGLRLLDEQLTHKVITVCVAHENLLVSSDGGGMAKSKLQIVELAVGGGEDADGEEGEDRARVKAQVATESGVQALATTLADVRVADASAFVRYHSSKLTVLLQDTVKPSAKFLAVATLPGSLPTVDARTARAVQWLQRFRQAVGSSQPGAGTSYGGSSDRSVEGFINRFSQHADGVATKAGTTFSSSELAGLPPLAEGEQNDGRRWEKELEHMRRRYGDLHQFTTSFYRPPLPPATEAAVEPAPLPTPRRKSDVDQLTDVVLRPHDVAAAVESGVLPATAAALPPPAPAKATRSKSKLAAVRSRVPGHRNGSKTAAAAKRFTVSGDTTTTLAPRAVSTTPVVKLRRDTASSTLKKAAAAASAHHLHALRAKSTVVAHAASISAVSAAPVHGRKIPFK